ncbi:methylmalonyl-CoA mutase family protein, partial [Halorubrum lacusprofundi]|uniref:methylmalonyl-CoA mutase family protein n=1 Tax=Halorubrum lacusprofundi TaxID=2247 RepID=UPI001F5B06DA
RDRFATVSNHEVDRLYTPADVADIDYEEDLGFPGEEPYTRGVDHSYTGDLTDVPLESRCLMEADLLDKVGANGAVLMLLRMGY